MRMLVLGAGLQGSACAFDLLQNPEVTDVRLADLNVGQLAPFLASYTDAHALAGRRPRLIPTPFDARDREAARALVREADAVMSALPYYLNEELARYAAEEGTHFSDLGGNTEIVFRQKELDAAAKASGASIIPDCGLAPGMVNILAQHGIELLEARAPRDVGAHLRRRAAAAPEGLAAGTTRSSYSLEEVLDYTRPLVGAARRRRQEARR
jgi:lysine 6-dehydrogenase